YHREKIPIRIASQIRMIQGTPFGNPGSRSLLDPGLIGALQLRRQFIVFINSEKTVIIRSILHSGQDRRKVKIRQGNSRRCSNRNTIAVAQYYSATGRGPLHTCPCFPFLTGYRTVTGRCLAIALRIIGAHAPTDRHLTGHGTSYAGEIEKAPGQFPVSLSNNNRFTQLYLHQLLSVADILHHPLPVSRYAGFDSRYIGTFIFYPFDGILFCQDNLSCFSYTEGLYV